MTAPRVRVLRTLGLGGMGVVHLAERELLPGVTQRAVVKRPRRDEPPSPRFLEEARALARVDHGNVVKLLDAGEDNGIWLLLEYVDGADLDAVLAAAAEGPALTPDEVGWIAHEAARGLQAAHGARDPQGTPTPIYHRDVSPQNLLASRTGEVKVTDFGIAWAADRTSRTTTGTVVGNLRYISPEQLEGRPVSPATDVYGLGRVLDVLLEVTTPHPDREALLALAARATRRAPAERHASLEALLDDLVVAVPTLCLGRPRLAARVSALADTRARVHGALAGMLAADRHTDTPPPSDILSRGTARITPAPDLVSASRPTPSPTAPAAGSLSPTVSPRGLPVRVTAAVALCTALLALFLLRPHSPGHPVAVPVRTVPWTAPPVEHPTVVSAPTAPAVLAAPVRPVHVTPREGVPAIAVRRAAHPAETVVPPGVPSSVPSVPAPQPSATLRVNSIPWAMVSVDDSPAVVTPHDFAVPAGDHTVHAAWPALNQSRSQSVRVSPGDTRPVTFELPAP